jgi:hypothetical protein
MLKFAPVAKKNKIWVTAIVQFLNILVLIYIK